MKIQILNIEKICITILKNKWATVDNANLTNSNILII